MKLKSNRKCGQKPYSWIKEKCLSCKYKTSCFKSKTGQMGTVSTNEHEQLKNEIIYEIQQLSSKVIYAGRRTTVESVSGQIKNNGFRYIHLRGFEIAGGEFAPICSCHKSDKSVKNLRNINFWSSSSNNPALCSFLAEQSVNTIKIFINRTLWVVHRCKVFCTETSVPVSVSRFVYYVKSVEKNSCFRTDHRQVYSVPNMEILVKQTTLNYTFK